MISYSILLRFYSKLSQERHIDYREENYMLTVLCSSGVAFARDEAKAGTGMARPPAGSRIGMTPMSYGTESIPPENGTSGILRPGG